MNIRLEMLNYTVRIRVAGGASKDVPKALAWVRWDNSYQCTMWFRTGKKVTLATLVHELTHVIQHIVDDYHLVFQQDAELTAYAAEYIFLRVAGYQHKRRAP